jgi:hypothetical protein
MSSNYRTIDLPNFSSILQILRVFISTLQLEKYDGVFPAIGGVDIHMQSKAISPLADGMRSIGLYNSWVATSLVLTYNEIPVHKDNAHEFDYSLNLPILNTERTYTSFYKVTHPPVTKYLPNGLPYDVYEKECCEVLDVVEIKAPTLLNVKVPHGVTLSGGPVPRITLALRINNVYENLFGDHTHVNGIRR